MIFRARRVAFGFTLIELLVVISIITLLASIILVALQNSRLQAHDALRISQVQEISTALELYYSDHGSYLSMTCDSRPSIGHGCWQSGGAFYSALVPKYIADLPPDPTNASVEGYMCSNCGEYLYSGTASHYLVSTYLATNHPQKSGIMWNNYAEVPAVTPPPFTRSGSTLWGPFYAKYNNCTLVAQDECD